MCRDRRLAVGGTNCALEKPSARTGHRHRWVTAAPGLGVLLALEPVRGVMVRVGWLSHGKESYKAQQSEMPWPESWFPTPTGSVILGKLFNLPEPQFPQLYNGNNNIMPSIRTAGFSEKK